MFMNVLFLSIIASAAAFVGGLVALKSRSKLHLALGFTAGIILGLVVFDLLPEIFEITENTGIDPVWPMVALATGFLFFHTVEKLILLHHSQEGQYVSHQHPHVGVVGAVALAGHSFIDGVSIGVAFQVSATVGILVAIAVIGHRFADGFNTTNVMLYHKNKTKNALTMLVIASAMPILGGLSTLFFTLPQEVLGLYLGFFAGFLLYIGASDILPQAHARKSSWKTIVLTITGVVCIFVITQTVHI